MKESSPPAYPLRGTWLKVDLQVQQITLFHGRCPLESWPVSTALKGAGEQNGSGCTPRGWHRIRIKIGDGEPLYTVFRGRRPTGERWSPELGRRFPQRDWILTRILWLSGIEPGRNRGGACDTLRRYIYIHGTPDDQPLGVARSHGCIRMANHDLIALFNRVEAGTRVLIQAGECS